MKGPYEELEAMGRALGGLWWVQGPGGNVSVKTEGGELWVKASGARLAEVARDGGHARAPLELARQALEGDAAADAALFARAPRPSLETYFHALDGRVIAHTHALGALLAACARGPLEPEFARMVTEVPYVRPGRGVAVAMRERADTGSDEQVFLLRSHGLVAVAPTAARAIALTERADELARRPFGRTASFEDLVARFLAYEPVAVDGGFAQVLPSRTLARESGCLFPDAAVCASVVSVDSLAELAVVAPRALAAAGRALVLAAPDGRRAAAAKSASQLRYTVEVLAAHDWLEDALGPRGAAAYLPDEEPAAILNLPSEQYRIRLAARE